MPEIKLELEQFNPDMRDNANLLLADNILFSEEGIIPHNSFKVQGSGTFDNKTNQIITVLDQTYMIGGKKLYRLSDTYSPIDVTKSGVDYSEGNFTDYTEFNGKLIFTDKTKNIQALDLGNTSAKADDLLAMKAKTIATIKNFLIVGNIDNSDGVQPYTVKWSGIGDETDFTPSASTQSGQQNLVNGGNVQRIIGGSYGTIFLDDAIYRMDFTGGALIFSFNQVDDIGTSIPEGVVKSGDAIYFWSKSGLRVTNGSSASQPIGNGRVDNWFKDNWDGKSLVNGIKINNTDLIYWSFIDKFDRKLTLIYNTTLNKFSTLSLNYSAIGQFKVPQTSIDSLTSSIDDIIGSFDNTPTYSPELCIIMDGKFKVIDNDGYLKSNIRTGYINLTDITMATTINPNNTNRTVTYGRIHSKLYDDSTSDTTLWASSHDKTYNINVRSAGRKMSFELTFDTSFGILTYIVVSVTGNSKR